MNIIFPSDKIYLSQSLIPNAGLGVFAKKAIKKEEVIDIVPVLIIPEEQLPSLTKTKLFDYYFAWGEGFKEAAVAWGYGSLFNHSYEPNAKYIKDMENNVIRFVAIRQIKADEEILVNYNGHPDDKTKLWFLERGNHNNNS